MDPDIENSSGRKRACKPPKRGLIINPGAIGDCLLTLPLAKFMKDALGLDGVDLSADSDYTHFYPGRTCIDSVASINSGGWHRFFSAHNEFEIEHNDPLVRRLSRYEWIVSFMGHGNFDFERNLAYAVNCVRSAEVSILEMIPADVAGHISDHYIREFLRANPGVEMDASFSGSDVLIELSAEDTERGREILKGAGVGGDEKVVVMHPGSGGQHKCWGAGNFIAVAEKLKGDGIAVVFVLGPAEMERFSPETVAEFAACGRCLTGLDLLETACVLSRADVFVGNDSGISHLAAAMGRPTVAIFGPTDAGVYGPLGPNARVFAAKNDDFTAGCCGEWERLAEMVRGSIND